jgi:glycosyltransferase involved in cell wall biosynthesis
MQSLAVRGEQALRLSGSRRFTRRLPSISVVIPTLNEERNLPGVLARLPADVHELILVDGNSTDGTVAVARSFWPRVVVVQQRLKGKGDDIIVAIDGDGSTDPAEIPHFVAALQAGADMAKGSRFLADGGSDDLTPMRRVGARGLTTLVNVLFGTRYTDLCYGYTAFWRDCLGRMTTAVGFEVETAMNISAARAGLVVVEVPSFERARVHGTSNLRIIRDGVRILGAILGERVRRRPVREPAVAVSVEA